MLTFKETITMHPNIKNSSKIIFNRKFLTAVLYFKYSNGKPLNQSIVYNLIAFKLSTKLIIQILYPVNYLGSFLNLGMNKANIPNNAYKPHHVWLEVVSPVLVAF